MEIDDPSVPEFASWRSYHNFSERVRAGKRLIWPKEVRAFLDTVLATNKERDVNIRQGTVLFRAQQGIEYQVIKDEGGRYISEEPMGYSRLRMKPLARFVREGRANSAGIPVLYLASTEETAISEVRPWVGSEISVAQFRVLRDLRAINLSVRFGESAAAGLTFAHLLDEEAPNPEAKERAVWTSLDNAFSQPVTRSDNVLDYVPTQILTELFWGAGYDAIIYRSQFGEKGLNIALCNLPDAEAINCAPYRVSKIRVEYQEIGNRWYLAKDAKVSNEKTD